uniref:Uncharacterized protein n=1 Tax=Arundo donax TaxID=35708 RepID=A0A0A9CGR6_ARUDO
MLMMGLLSPISAHALTTRYSFCAISASPRCTALKSSSASFWPLTILEAAPPPIPILYAGPPIFTTSMPISGSPFDMCAWSICPIAPLNIIGFSHSRRSPFSNLIPKFLVNP